MSEAVTAGLVESFGYGLAYPDWLDPASPAAGAALSVSVDGFWNLRVVAATCSITTDANVANRLVSLDFVNARGITYARNAASVLVTASTTGQVFWWALDRTVAEWNTGTPVFVPVLNAFLPPGFSVKFAVDSIQAGDQLSAVHLWVEKYPTGARGYPVGMIRSDVAVQPQ